MRRRLVRVHLVGSAPSLEGVLVGWPHRHAGHYVIEAPKLIEAENRTLSLDGRATHVPREKVLFIQEIHA